MVEDAEFSDSDFEKIERQIEAVPEWVFDSQVIKLLGHEGLMIDLLFDDDNPKPLIYVHSIKNRPRVRRVR